MLPTALTRRARDALIRGVEAAHRAVRRQGFRQLQSASTGSIGPIPPNEASFWGYLRDHGGRRFARSVDWVGLDAYPGTVFPPVDSPIGTGFRDGMVNAMSQLRDCFMPIAGLGRGCRSTSRRTDGPPVPGRTEHEQVVALRQMVGAVTTSAVPTTSPTTAGSTSATTTRRRPTSSTTTGCSATTTRQSRPSGSTGGCSAPAGLAARLDRARRPRRAPPSKSVPGIAPMHGEVTPAPR